MSAFIRRSAAVVAGTTVFGIALAGCVGGGSSGTGDAASIDTSKATGTVEYWLWDNNQKAAYQQCADDFHAANPDVTVNITQYSWDDYWTKITNGFVSGTGPDVFTDHLSKYADFINNNQLVALDDVVAKDGIDLSQYTDGLADLWVGQDGKRYGLPKDWDTIAIFYNQDLVSAGGYSAEQLADLQWNPEDGGTYEEAIAHLTVDANGVRGDEPGFDKTRVAVYGLGLDNQSGGGIGQTQWSMYSGSTGWEYMDENPWGTKYNYDDERFQSTIGWMADLIEKGYMPSVAEVTGGDSTQTFGAGKYAMITNGSWNINSFFGLSGVDVGIAPTPMGPRWQAREHVQRSGRLHLGGLEEQGRGGRLGRVPGFGRLPERHRRRRCRLPGDPQWRRSSRRRVPEPRDRCDAVHPAGGRRDHLPLADLRQRCEDRRDHDARGGRCDGGQGRPVVADQRERAGQRPVRSVSTSDQRGCGPGAAPLCSPSTRRRFPCPRPHRPCPSPYRARPPPATTSPRVRR
ncbi:ABC-type glycerol-3-phosphate transport system substrate-binding protein [Microbacterium proteolyticum]|uniref:ABC transporter substrate-binding protein n=1 Tax=Microbacterium proteolyticum TaxID=1572644 RepID=UPI00278976CF|nr:sugar ABC transporter substrate-binding protein [Microbacterium proteolyticum]MDQ1169479.1 ABC-type glycerol-3-phosphate transport system substrate-binding protein [Microbacterium proteolyticum]